MIKVNQQIANCKKKNIGNLHIKDNAPNYTNILNGYYKYY